MTKYSYGSGSVNQPMATPRLSGLLGGAGFDLSAGPTYPALDQNLGWQLPGVAMGATASWTRYFVWTRPNWRTNVYPPPVVDSSANVLLSAGGTPILQADGSAGTSRLILFPNSAAAVLSSSLARRHTHSVILQNVPGSGVSAWLDGAKVATNVANPIAGTGIATLLLLHGGNGYQAGAQCWLHEFATWESAISGASITGLAAYAARWALGPRKGVQLVMNGQSNAANYTLADGAAAMLAKGVAWYLGASAYGFVGNTQNSGGPGTIDPGIGIYNFPISGVPTYASSFLVDPGDGSDPSGWSRGKMGNNVAAYIAEQASDDQSDIAALMLLWSETDSYRPYSEWTTFQHAAKRWIRLLRGMVAGATAANMPVCWWNAIPFGFTSGIQMHREVIASLAADPTQGVVLSNPMTADSNSRGATWDPSTGIQTGGDNQHRDGGDNVIFAWRAAPLVARALYATGWGDGGFTAIPSGLPVAGGPSITHAYLQNATTVILTVTHDAGNDLVVPLLAAVGQGFLVMDGGSVASPGTLVPATACARVDATHLRITLSQAVVNAAAACLLFYPYGSYTPTGAPSYRGDMGRGNAVTDNFASVAKPAGWDIGGDLGSAWNINYPLAATTTPITLSASPT